MPFYETDWWRFLMCVAAVPVGSTAFVLLMHSRAVRGTRERYVLATAQRVLLITQVPMLVMTAATATQRPAFWIPFLMMAILWVSVYDSLDSEDDNWFTRTGTRLRRKVRNLASAPGRAVPSGA